MLDQLSDHCALSVADLSRRDGLFPPELDQIAPDSMRLIESFYRRRIVWTLPLAKHKLNVTPLWQRDEPRIGKSAKIFFTVDGEPGELLIPESFVKLVLTDIDPAIEPDRLSPEHIALLIEFAFSDMLDSLEAASGCAIECVAIEMEARQEFGATRPKLTALLQYEGLPDSWCILRLGTVPMSQLTDTLRRHAKPVARAWDLSVPVYMRWGAVALTLAECRGLNAGDIIMLDHSCGQNGLALAVIANHLVVPVELQQTGYRVSEAPRPANGSAFAWSTGGMAADAEVEASRDELQLPVFIEFGRLEVPLSEVRELKADQMLPLARPLAEGLDIVAGGVCIGRGELTTIGNETGVRLTRLNR